MVMEKKRVVPLLILFFLLSSVLPCIAVEPAWTFSDENRKINDLAVAPDGSAVVVGMGRVVLLSRNGTVLAKEPYGDVLAQSRDGSTIATAYSSSDSSTVYLFEKQTAAGGYPILQKLWDTVTPDKVVSLAVSDNGERIALSSGGISGVHVYAGKTGNRVGHSNEYSSLIAISGNGNTIAGISMVQGLKVYNFSGDFIIDSRGDFMNISSGEFKNNSRGNFVNISTQDFIKKYDTTLSGQPNSFHMDTEGNIVVFNAGPQIIAFDVVKGAELWRRKSTSDVNMLAMTPSGNNIVAGNENGTIENYDSKGNLVWTFYSNSGTGNGQAIKAVSIARNGLKIVAGSVDGKILLLDSAGNLLWTYNTGKDTIRKVAIAADGSLAVAAGDVTLYAFPAVKQSTTRVPVSTRLTVPTERSVIPQQPVVPETQTMNTTEYSVIRKATQSPAETIIIITALMITAFFALRKTNESSYSGISDAKEGRE